MNRPQKLRLKHLPKFRVLTPTFLRNQTKFQYLKESFQSFNIEFTTYNISFEYIAFKRLRNHTFVPFQDPNFNFKTFTISKDYKMIKTNTIREKKIMEHNLDWITMMDTFQNQCELDEIFLLLEDDFILCKSSFWHLFSMYKWALNNMNLWSGIRMGIGLSGIFIQCKDIKPILNHIKPTALSKPMPIDMLIVGYWNSVAGLTLKENRTLITYRYNLFEHLGQETSVESSQSSRRFPKCFSILYMQIFPAVDYFNPWTCGHKIFSPCEEKSQNDFFQLTHSPETQVPVIMKERLQLMKDFNIQAISTNGKESCDQICTEKSMKCEESSFPFVNDCQMMRRAYGNCECQSHAFGVHPHDPVIVNSWYCSLQETPVFKCSSEIKLIYQGKRLCPCRPK